MKKIVLMLWIMLMLITVSAYAEGGTLPYTIDDMYFSDLMGREISELGDSCMINVEVSKTGNRQTADSIIIASYATDGELVGFSIMKANIPQDSATQFSTLIRVPEDKELGIVKAYIWNSITNMIPLSNSLRREVNEMLAAPKEPEKYIPDYFVVDATVGETYKSDVSLLRNEFKFYNVIPVYDYSDCITEEDYYAKEERYDAIYDYYGIFANCSIRVTSENVNFEEYLGQRVQLTLDKDYNIIDFSLINSENTVEFIMPDIDDYDDSYIYIYDSTANNITRYWIDSDAYIYVNGVEVGSYYNQYNRNRYISESDKLKLVDNDADGMYDYIIITRYGTAEVDTVSRNRILFSDQIGIGRGSLTLAQDDEDFVYHIYYEDEEIDISDLEEGDILSVLYDVTCSSISDSPFIEIYVSRDTAEGICTGKNYEEETVTIGEQDYSLVSGYMMDELTLGNQYALSLDIFGRIFGINMITSADNIAVLDRYYSSTSYDNDVGVFYFADGTTQTLEIDNAKVGMTNSEIVNKIYRSYIRSNDNKRPIAERIVEYKISSSSGKVISLKFLEPNVYATASEFRERTNAIGAVKLNDATNIIDAITYTDKQEDYRAVTYTDLSIAALSDLIDGCEYTAYGFGQKNSDGTVPFVVITKGEGAYTTDTRFAVVTKSLQTRTNSSNDEGYGLVALYEGEEKTFFVVDDAEVNCRSITDENYRDLLTKGDVIVFQTNSKDEVDTIDTILGADVIGLGDYPTTVANGITPNTAALILPPAYEWVTDWKDKENDHVVLAYGIITGKRSGYFQLSQVARDGNDLYSNLDLAATSAGNGGYIDVNISSDTNVYVFDYTQKIIANQLYVGVPADIFPVVIPRVYKHSTDYGEVIYWNEATDDGIVATDNPINFAFAKIVGGYATDVFVIIGDDNMLTYSQINTITSALGRAGLYDIYDY